MLNFGLPSRSENIEPPGTERFALAGTPRSVRRQFATRFPSFVFCVLPHNLCLTSFRSSSYLAVYARGECAYRYSQKPELPFLTGSSLLKNIRQGSTSPSMHSNFELCQVAVIPQTLHGDVAARPPIQTREERASA